MKGLNKIWGIKKYIKPVFLAAAITVSALTGSAFAQDDDVVKGYGSAQEAAEKLKEIKKIKKEEERRAKEKVEKEKKPKEAAKKKTSIPYRPTRKPTYKSSWSSSSPSRSSTKRKSTTQIKLNKNLFAMINQEKSSKFEFDLVLSKTERGAKANLDFILSTPEDNVLFDINVLGKYWYYDFDSCFEYGAKGNFAMLLPALIFKNGNKKNRVKDGIYGGLGIGGDIFNFTSSDFINNSYSVQGSLDILFLKDNFQSRFLLKYPIQKKVNATDGNYDYTLSPFSFNLKNFLPFSFNSKMLLNILSDIKYTFSEVSYDDSLNFASGTKGYSHELDFYLAGGPMFAISDKISLFIGPELDINYFSLKLNSKTISRLSHRVKAGVMAKLHLSDVILSAGLAYDVEKFYNDFNREDTEQISFYLKLSVNF